jgi:hypothetical protein
MDKKADPTYVRLRTSNKLRVTLLANQFGEVNESEIIDWLVGLGLDSYEFHMKHFATFPVGLNFRAKRSNGQDENSEDLLSTTSCELTKLLTPKKEE